MDEHNTLEKLKAGQQFCLRHLRRDGTLVGGASLLIAFLHFAFHTDLLMSALLIVCFWLAVAPFGFAYVILGFHIRRMS